MARINPDNEEYRRTILSQQQKKIEAQKVQQVEDVDPDSRAKQQAFRNLMQPDDTEDSDSAAIQGSAAPSPLESSFYKTTTNSNIDPARAVPNPTYSPAPNLNEGLPYNSFQLQPDDLLADDDLPQSSNMYSDVPWEPLNQPTMQTQSPSQPTSGETTNEKRANRVQATHAQNEKGSLQSSNNQRNTAQPGHPGYSGLANGSGKGSIPGEKKEPQLDANPFGLPGKAVVPKPAQGYLAANKTAAHVAHQKASQKKEAEQAPTTSPFWNSAAQIPPASIAGLSEKKESERNIAGLKKADGLTTRPLEKKAALKPFELIEERREKETSEQPAKERASERHSKSEKIDLPSLSLSNLPAAVQPAAEAAAVAAAPYLRPEMLSQFYQIVGTIFVMTPSSGISKTEFLLNNPAFANSKFFGATIEVTRYSTAPDAFNIRFSGSTEAVNAFNQNMPSLINAFQNGNFNFRIQRIEAEHSSKPVFHRKNEGQGNGESGSRGREQ